MERWSLFVAVATICLAAHGQQMITSVTDGGWMDSTTWDCNCVPADGDTMIIQHIVALYQNEVHLGGHIEIAATAGIYGTAVSTLTTTSSFINHGEVQLAGLFLLEAPAWIDSVINEGIIGVDKLVVRRRGRNTGDIHIIDSLVFDHTSFYNYGTISSRIAWVRDSLVWNEGSFLGQDVTIDSSGLFHNLGIFSASHDLLVRHASNFNAASGSLQVHVGHDLDVRWGLNVFDADITVVNDLILSDAEGPIPHLTFMVPGGGITTKDFVNKGWAQGPGTICISDSSVNEGDLQSQLILCDATPSTMTWPQLDVNTGTVAADVQFCPMGVCQVAIANGSAVRPVTAVFEAGTLLLTGVPTGDREIRVMDVAGRILYLTNAQGDTLLLSVPVISGMLIVELRQAGSVFVLRVPCF